MYASKITVSYSQPIASDIALLLVPMELDEDSSLFAQLSDSTSDFVTVFDASYWLGIGLILIAILIYLKVTRHMHKRHGVGIDPPHVWTWMQHYNLHDTLVVRRPSLVAAVFLISTSLLTLFTMR